MWEVMHACVIMNNMIIERERGDLVARDDHSYDHQGPLAIVDHHVPTKFADFLAMHESIHDEVVHHTLQNYLFL
jgi:hypothetical protein